MEHSWGSSEIFIVASMRIEHCAPLVPLLDPDQVVSIPKIQFSEKLALLKVGEGKADEGQQITILDC